MLYEDQLGRTWFKEEYLMLPEGMRQNLREVFFPDTIV